MSGAVAAADSHITGEDSGFQPGANLCCCLPKAPLPPAARQGKAAEQLEARLPRRLLPHYRTALHRPTRTERRKSRANTAPKVPGATAPRPNERSRATRIRNQRGEEADRTQEHKTRVETGGQIPPLSQRDKVGQPAGLHLASQGSLPRHQLRLLSAVLLEDPKRRWQRPSEDHQRREMTRSQPTDSIPSLRRTVRLPQTQVTINSNLTGPSHPSQPPIYLKVQSFLMRVTCEPHRTLITSFPPLQGEEDLASRGKQDIDAQSCQPSGQCKVSVCQVPSGIPGGQRTVPSWPPAQARKAQD